MTTRRPFAVRPLRPDGKPGRRGVLPAPLLTAALLAASLSACSPAASAPPAPPAPLSYVALGDSYASGLGAGSYSEQCGRSLLGLPGLLDAEDTVDLAADGTCAGAVAAPGAAPSSVAGQISQLVKEGSLGPQTDLVTVSAGGNDAGFGQVAGACAASPLESCRRLIEETTALALPALARDLDALYGQLRRAAPEAAVVVTGYPHLFSPEFGTAEALSLPAQEAFNAGTDSLNAVLEEASAAHGFLWVPTTEGFRSHGLGAPEPWITGAGEPDGLHPNAEGYRSGYLPAVLDGADLAALQRGRPAQ
ncbi:SGNH/GDSL hydrolase family protein [Arthrobacter zhaoguopingii]|uniref:SGNH/GDSL hydrolase family protein n=1 Tax=Arthrobacter zhaoguopingii TaxID=2681491 RepID=UPI001359FC9D|nr:SGNH/GDSL hydrolase family protein [Arthrobacter zhaoguopingii]